MPKGILELDRFTEANVDRWNAVSQDLDELNDILHFGLEPERRRRRKDLLDALSREPQHSIDLEGGWVRIVSYQFSLAPLSCAGSLTYIGGRFNAGLELEPNTINAWPALYLAENFETAFREKFQRAQDEKVDGLTPQELALHEGGSHSTVRLTGKLTKVFDLTNFESLNGVAQVLSMIKMPERAVQMKKRLKIPVRDLTMLKTGRQLFDMTVVQNWRILPVQFGMPAPSHILAEMISAAGFEAIIYASSKGAGRCLAVFPEKLAPGSYIELLDEPPMGVNRRLDIETAEDLAGWEVFGPSVRSKRSL